MSQYINPELIPIILSGIVIISALMVISAAWYIRKAVKNIKTTTILMNTAAQSLEQSFSSLVKAMLSIEEIKKLQTKDNQQIILEGEKKNAKNN